MLTNNTVAIYCDTEHDKLVEYVQKNYDHIICLYDDIMSENIYNLPRFHYTEINNYGCTVIIDNLKLYDRLKDKNNKIIYYMDSNPNHSMNYKDVFGILENIDGVLLYNKQIDSEAMKIIFNYTKELLYV